MTLIVFATAELVTFLTGILVGCFLCLLWRTFTKAIVTSGIKQLQKLTTAMNDIKSFDDLEDFKQMYRKMR
ncbi:MAG: hypothetical protein AAFO04_29660 [Cyanobacteria bacterium J06592_8]